MYIAETVPAVNIQSRTACPWHILAAPEAHQVKGKALLTTGLKGYTFICLNKLLRNYEPLMQGAIVI